MPYSATVNAATIQQWVASNLTPQDVEENLQKKGLDANLIAEHLKEFKRQRYAKRQFTGFIFTGAGAFLGFVSCMLTVTNPYPPMYDLVLYGLTGLAICVITIGLYYIFE